MPPAHDSEAREAARIRAALPSLVLVAAFALAALLSLHGNRPPAPAGADAPAGAFSAARAQQVLARILGDGRPHPTGSPANAALRDRVVAEFARIGLDAEIRRRFVCGDAVCATIDNLVARLPGASAERAVLLSAHYDSVAAGPGASDDGAGVAALIEAARALRAGPPLPRDIWLLVNDGEELGLLGAEAFVREPEFANVATVVNLEARGTTGASLLIETQPGNAAVIAAVRRALARPAGTSLDYEIYKTLPNDTDFTVYRREGRSGVNFAWAEGAARYHTPLDNLAQLDPGSLQHHGDNLLAMAREFASAPADFRSPHDAVFFSVGGHLVSWPVGWNPFLLLAGLGGWIALVARLVRAGQARTLPLLGAVLAGFAVLVLLAGLGWAMHALLGRLGATPAAWTAQQSSLVATFVLLAVAVALLVARPLVRRFGAAALAAAGLLPFALLAAATVAGMPGGSYTGLLPLLAGVLAGHALPRHPASWSGIAAIVAALLWSVYAIDAASAIGHDGLPATTVLAGLTLLPLLPALARFGRGACVAGAAALVATAAFAVLAVLRPAFDADVPRALNLVYAGSGETARVFVRPDPAPAGFLREAGFATDAEPMLPWSTHERLPGPAGPALAAPRFEILDDAVADGRRQVRLRLRSARGATELGLRLPARVDLASLRIDGEPLAAPRRPRADDWHAVAVIGVPAGGVEFAFDAEPGRAIELYGLDVSAGIPRGLDEVVRARDRIAVPIHGGDTRIAWARLALPPG